MKNLLLLALLLTPSSLFATTYYTAKDCSGGAAPPNCSDTNNGTSRQTAKLTIAAGLALASAGDTLEVYAGTYYERILVPASGTSGMPITIRGERGAADEYLTIVDGSDLVGTSWTAEPGIGAGVYSTTLPSWSGPITSQTNYPCNMTADGKAVWHISEYWDDMNPSSYGGGGDKFDVLNADTAGSGVDAAFTNDVTAGKTYVRFYNGDNPNSKTIRLAPWGTNCDIDQNSTRDFAPFSLNDKNYITIRDFEIQGAWAGILVQGSSTGNIFEHNKIHDGQFLIQLQGSGVVSTTIRNNIFYGNMYGYTGGFEPQAFTGSSVPARILADNVYQFGKNAVNSFLVGSTFALRTLSAVGTSFTDNTVYDHSGVFLFTPTGTTTVSGNTIHNCVSTGVYFQNVSAGTIGTLTIANNLIYECDTPIRMNQSENATSGTVYIYSNRIFAPLDTLTGMFYLTGSGDTAADIYIYHNTQIGGADGPSWSQSSGADYANKLIINNLIQTANSSVTLPKEWSGSYGSYCSNGAYIRRWDTNWTFGSEYSCAWMSNNINAGAKLFTDTSLPADWLPPDGSAPRGAAIDVSGPFTVNSVNYSALPGFSPGYARDIGAEQYVAPGGNFTLVSSTIANSGADANTVTTSGIDTSGAAVIALSVSGYLALPASLSVSDNKSNSWTCLAEQLIQPYIRNKICYSLNPTSGTGHTFTATATSAFPCVAAQAWTTTLGNLAIDFNTGATADSVTTVLTGSITPSKDDSLIVSGITSEVYPGGVVSIGSGFTITNQSDWTCGMAYKVLTASAATNPTWGTNSAGDVAVTIADFVPIVNLEFTTQPINVHTGGTMTAFVVTAKHSTGATDTTFDSNVTVAISGCAATLGGTLTVAASAGVATFSAVTASGNQTNCSLAASASLANSTTSNTFNVGPNALAITSQPGSSYASGDAVSFTVTARYASGQTDTSATNTVIVTATATSGSCAVSGSTTLALVAGVRAFSVTITGGGTCYLTATSADVGTANTNSFTVSGGSLTFSTNPPSTVTSGASFTVIVTANNSVFTNPVTLGVTGSCIITAPIVTPVAGVATFPGVVLVSGSGSCRLTASANFINSGTSAAFTVTDVVQPPTPDPITPSNLNPTRGRVR